MSGRRGGRRQVTGEREREGGRGGRRWKNGFYNVAMLSGEPRIRVTCTTMSGSVDLFAGSARMMMITHRSGGEQRG